jgi:hypothetical protein
MDYINTSHPNFIGGSMANEIALQLTKSPTAVLSVSRPKVFLALVPNMLYVLRHKK